MPSRRRFLFAALMLVLAAALAGSAILSGRPFRQQTASGTALVGGAFALTDQNGNRVTDRDFAGRYMLVYFGYSSCPDICPAGLQVIAAALDRLGPLGDAITPVFITIDPERDTAAVLRRFAARFHPRLVALTGSVDNIGHAARAFRVSPGHIGGAVTHADVPAHHSTIFYLMGPEGQYIRHFTYTTDAASLADELARAISR